MSVPWIIGTERSRAGELLWRDGYSCRSCTEGWRWRVEKWFASPLQGRRSPTPSRDFHFLVEFDLLLSLEGRSNNHSFSASTSLGGCVRETSSHRTCLTVGIAVHRQFPGGMCLSLWNPPAVLLLETIQFIFPQLWITCLPSGNLLGYFGPFRKIDPVTLMIWSIFN